MPPPRRARRPLIALIALVLLLVVGYTVQAVSHRNRSLSPGPDSTMSRTTTVGSAGRAGCPGPHVEHWFPCLPSR